MAIQRLKYYKSIAMPKWLRVGDAWILECLPLWIYLPAELGRTLFGSVFIFDLLPLDTATAFVPGTTSPRLLIPINEAVCLSPTLAGRHVARVCSGTQKNVNRGKPASLYFHLNYNCYSAGWSYGSNTFLIIKTCCASGLKNNI